MRMKPSLTASDAQMMMEACNAEAMRHNRKAAVAIVDEAGILLRFERMDGTSPMTAENALGKARMAALTGKPSKFWEDLIQERPVFLKFNFGLPIQGGLPILHDGHCVGAIGVSGGQSHEDEQVAAAGVAALPA